MTQFETILNHYKDLIGGGKYIGFEHRISNIIACRIDEDTCHIISINDLLSPNSGFLQSVKWKENRFEILVRTEVAGLTSPMESGRCYGYTRQYHSMRLAILPDEEKIKYLELNIIIDD